MRRFFFISTFIVFITGSHAISQTLMFQVSIRNEYTGWLEHPQNYGLTIEDIEYTIFNLDQNYDCTNIPSSVALQDVNNRVVLKFDTQRMGNVGEYLEVIIRINKPGHRLDGVSEYTAFMKPVRSINYMGDLGIILDVPLYQFLSE